MDVSAGQGPRIEVAAFAKVNLALLVGPRRRDGYHEVFSLMVPVTLADLLIAEEATGGSETVVCDVCPGDENLAAVALRELAQRVGRPLPMRLEICKRIPHAAGLGGGSSDAAAAIGAAERLFDLQLSQRVRYEAAVAVGSDVPFFLWPGAQLAMGRGTVLRAVSLPDPLAMVVAVPTVELPARLVYGWRDEDTVIGLREFAARTTELLRGVESARTAADVADLIVNDLEQHVVARRPEIGAVKQALLDGGAIAAAMSGSGAAVFGLFSSSEVAEAARAIVIARAGLSPGRVFTVSDIQPPEAVLRPESSPPGPARHSRPPRPPRASGGSGPG